MHGPRLADLKMIENWLPSWLFETDRWRGATQRFDNDSTLTSVWRTFGAEAKHTVVLQMMYGARPEKLAPIDGRYLMRVAKGIVHVKLASEFEDNKKAELVSEAVLSAGSVWTVYDLDAQEYMRPFKTVDALLVRVHRSDDDALYKDGEEMNVGGLGWFLKQFKPMYGGKGARFG